MKMSLIVPQKNISHFKTALHASGGWHFRNPTKLADGDCMVSIQFSEDGRGYNHFWEVYDNLTGKIVEIDNRKWYTKFLNRFRAWFKK